MSKRDTGPRTELKKPGFCKARRHVLDYASKPGPLTRRWFLIGKGMSGKGIVHHFIPLPSIPLPPGFGNIGKSPSIFRPEDAVPELWPFAAAGCYSQGPLAPFRQDVARPRSGLQPWPLRVSLDLSLGLRGCVAIW